MFKFFLCFFFLIYNFICKILYKNQKDGIGGSYRLASLDRLATRQRILEQNGGHGTPAAVIAVEKNGTNENGGSIVDGRTSAAVRRILTKKKKSSSNFLFIIFFI